MIPLLAVKFKYNNHKGEDHEYVVEPEAIERVTYGAFGHSDDSVSDGPHYVLHGLVLTRDGESKRMIRRTFVLTKIRDLEETMEELPT